MAARLTTVTVGVEGMSCGSCEARIERTVSELEGVVSVKASAPAGKVAVGFDPTRVDTTAIEGAIRSAGYSVREKPSSGRARGVLPFLGLVAIAAGIYLALRFTVGFDFLPAVSQSMGFGLIFVVGLVTSVHCVAMCGGIVLSQGIARDERLVPSLLYNAGRVVSYTVIGGVAGGLGSVLSISATLKGAVPVVAGVFMAVLGVRMLGIFPWLSNLRIRIPGFGGGRLGAAAGRRGPFVVGLLNGLMPCGPLQTVQVYALGTGSVFAGALSMFLFSLGTVPLLLGFGALGALLSSRFTRGLARASGVLVAALGVVMFTRGLSLFGVALPRPALGPSIAAPAASGAAVARLSGGVQEVASRVEVDRYQPLVVQQGIPVRWTIEVKAADLNGCNNPITVPRYGIRRRLVPGTNVIEFTPDRSGPVAYTCWMGMVTSTITVVPDLASLTPADLSAVGRPTGSAGTGSIPDAFGGAAGRGSCGAGPTSGRFAGGRIPADQILAATLVKDAGGGLGQVVDVHVGGDGYSPAVVVVQRGLRAKFRFVADRLDSCNAVVAFPAYRGQLNLAAGQLETPFLEVGSDFVFQCGMGMLHGYVKVVDDLRRYDAAAIARQVDGYRADSGGGCCGGGS
jgi:copper ion binding protein